MKKVLSPWCKEAKKAMIDKDMSIAELADKLDLSTPYVTRILNGTFNIPDTQQRISKYLDIPLELISA